MAARRGIGQFAELMLQQYMKQKQARFESNLVGERQKELAGYNAQFSILDRLRSDPNLARRLQQRGQMPIGGFPIEDFIPTAEQEGEEASKGIAGVKDLQGLPTAEDIQGQYGGRVPIEQLMKQVAARNDVIKGGAAPVKQAEMAANGATTDRYVNPYNEPGPFQTGVSGQQAGINEGEKQKATLQTPGLAEAEAIKQNTIERSTRPGAIARAGGIAGAQAAATNAVEWSPQMIAKKLDFESKKAQANLINQGKLEQMKENNATITSLTMLLPRIEELKTLSIAINTKGKLNVLGRASTSAAGYLGTDPDAAKMAQLQDSIAIGMANSLGGNKGQVSEADKNAMKAILMGPFDSDELANSKLADLKMFYELIPQLLEQADISELPSVRIAKATRALQIYKAAKGIQ